MKTAMLTVVPLALAAGVWADPSTTIITSGGDITHLPTLTYANSDAHEDFRGKYPKYEVKARFTNEEYWKQFTTSKEYYDANNDIIKHFKEGCFGRARAEQPTLTDTQIQWALYQPDEHKPVNAWCSVVYIDEVSKKQRFVDYMPTLAEQLKYKITLTKDSPQPINKGASSKADA